MTTSERASLVGGGGASLENSTSALEGTVEVGGDGGSTGPGGNRGTGGLVEVVVGNETVLRLKTQNN
jgi:hypothetical protein